MIQDNEKRKETLKALCDVITDAELNGRDIIQLVIEFLYSIGSSMESDSDLQTSEAVLMSYAEKPSIGKAFMAQALWMRDYWLEQARKENEQLRREIEAREVANPVQDIQGSKREVWRTEDEPEEGME